MNNVLFELGNLEVKPLERPLGAIFYYDWHKVYGKGEEAHKAEMNRVLEIAKRLQQSS